MTGGTSKLAWVLGVDSESFPSCQTVGSLLGFHEAVGPAEAYVISSTVQFGWFVSTQDVRVGKLEVLMDYRFRRRRHISL